MRNIAICLVVLGVPLDVAPAAVSASGPGSSAGDNQYIDPLSGSSTTTSQTSAPATTAPQTTAAPTSSPPAATAPSGPGPSAGTQIAPSTQSTPSARASSSTTQTTPTATASSAQTSDSTLPYTGLDVSVGAIVAAGFLAAGFALSWASRAHA